MYLEGKKIIKVLPYYPIIILCGGFFCEFTYYKNFGVNISYYLEPSEILLLFSKDLIQYTFFTAVMYLLMFLTSSSKYDTAKADTLIDIHLDNIADENFDEKSLLFFLLLPP